LQEKETKKLDDSSRLDVVEFAHVPDMLPSFFLPGRANDSSAPPIWEKSPTPLLQA